MLRRRECPLSAISGHASQQTTSLFDHVVDADLQRQRHSEKEKDRLAVAAMDCFILIRRPN